MNEGRNEHPYEIFRRKEGRKNEGRYEHHYKTFRRKEEWRKGGMGIIMKYLEGMKEE